MWKGAPRALGAKPLWPYLVGAKADTIRLTASTQLLAIGAQRRGLGEADGPAAARRAPAEVVVDPLPGNPPGQTFPGGEIYPEYVKSSETVAVSWFGVRWLAR